MVTRLQWRGMIRENALSLRLVVPVWGVSGSNNAASKSVISL